MGKITLNKVNKVDRGNERKLYSTIIKEAEINSWNFTKKEYSLGEWGGVTRITGSTIYESCVEGELSIVVHEPVLIVPNEILSDDLETVVLIGYGENLLNSLVNSLIRDPIIGSLIETKNKKISKNSTKIIRADSLKDLLGNFLGSSTKINKDQLRTALVEYLHEFLEVNSVFYPSSLQEMQAIKEETVIYIMNTWYIIFREFFEQWETCADDIKVPSFVSKVYIDNWVGQFFDRDNPIWRKIYNHSGRPHYPSLKNQQNIYREWKKATS